MAVPVDILLPTAYFPPVSWCACLIRSKSVHIEQMETFPKQTYRNRCEIMTASGPLNLIVPVTKPNGDHTITRDVEISYREPWQQHHWKSIQTAYRSSPYFIYYADILQPLFESGETSLIEHNYYILSVINRILHLDVSIEFTSEYIKLPEELIDLRKEISPKKGRHGLSFSEYPQVFSHKSGFMPDLSILDLLCNLGPEAKGYLISC
jgi:hypothetical protein